jgi:hypothetical protein
MHRDAGSPARQATKSRAGDSVSIS